MAATFHRSPLNDCMTEQAHKSVPIEHRFSPYTDNGGTIVAVAGKDFCVIAGDTRQSEGYSINSRNVPKCFPLNGTTVLANAGFAADGVNLAKRVKQRMEWYSHAHDKEMSTPASAQMLQTILYGKRFFPYYVFNILGGLDHEGHGCIYSFDPVGSYERRPYQAGGSAASLIQPFLDNQIGLKNQVTDEKVQDYSNLPLESVLKIVKDSFTSATERDIHTGDYLQLVIVRPSGIEEQQITLKFD